MSIIVQPLTDPATPLDFTALGSSVTPLSIINHALLLNNSQPAQALDEPIPNTMAAVELYDLARDETLMAAPWPCARKELTLPRSATTPLSGYTYAYQLPVDCLRLIAITSTELENRRSTYDTAFTGGLRTTELYPEFSWRRLGDKLHTNEVDLMAEYTARIVDPAQFDPLLANAVGVNLALKLCQSLSGSTSLQELFTRMYGDYLTQARAAAGSEQYAPDTWGDSSRLLDARSASNRGWGY